MKSAPALDWSHIDSRDGELVDRCALGDQAAFAELVDGHQRMVFQLALHLLGDRQEALDLSQEVFLRVFRSLHQFRGQSALRTWIYRIVVTQARNRQRWWRRRYSHEQVSFDEHVKTCGDLPSTMLASAPDAVLSQKELARRLWAALESLPFDQRSAIVLREIDGLSYEEIGFSLGVTVGTVKSRLARARDGLRARLREA
ncbi:MAG: sigma-70 family RNA polymerase sigma factor [Vicinamibacterales bacterium]